MHQMVNGWCPACVATGGGEAHVVHVDGGGHLIGGGGGGGFSPEVTEDRRPYVELAEGGASQGGASYVGGGVRADGGGVSSVTATGTGGNSHEKRGGYVGEPGKPTRPLVGPISWRIMPAPDGQIVIHSECDRDPDRWWMMYLTADRWDAFKRAGDLMFDADQTGRA